MKRLLYIQASPRGERSHSVTVADAFVDAWKAANPGGEVVVKNLFDVDLPSFDGLTINGKYNIMHGKEHTDAEKKAWAAVESVIEEFKSFDGYAFAVPMWNFSIPYRLKHYIDLLVQPGYTVGMDENGYFGMVEGKKAFVAFASGGTYTDDNPLETFNFQSTYMRGVLGFMGITDVVEANPRGTLMDVRDDNKSKALDEARALAASF